MEATIFDEPSAAQETKAPAPTKKSYGNLDKTGKRHAMSEKRVQKMLRRVEKELEADDAQTDPAKKLNLEQRLKLYDSGKHLMDLLMAKDRLKAAENKVKHKEAVSKQPIWGLGR